jgi:hypothetical protein
MAGVNGGAAPRPKDETDFSAEQLLLGFWEVGRDESLDSTREIQRAQC